MILILGMRESLISMLKEKHDTLMYVGDIFYNSIITKIYLMYVRRR